MPRPRRAINEGREGPRGWAGLVSRGVHATGIEAHQEGRGASPSGVCHLFGGVNDLVVALLLRTAERWIAHLTKGVIATKTGAEAIAALVDGHLEWVLAHRKAARFLFTRPWLWSLQAPSADALRSSKRN